MALLASLPVFPWRVYSRYYGLSCLNRALVPLQFSSANSLELVKEQWSSYKNQCLDYLSSAEPSTGDSLWSKWELYPRRRSGSAGINPTVLPLQGWFVTGPLTCTPAGQMDFQEQPSTCPARGSCPGTAKVRVSLHMDNDLYAKTSQ